MAHKLSSVAVFSLELSPLSSFWGPPQNTVAEFIHDNMPYQFDGVLTEQEAWDLATFIDGQPRPNGDH